MKSEDVKSLLPIIEAFANKRPLMVRSKLTSEWTRINPNTTEFLFAHLTDKELEWRIFEDAT